MGAGPDQVRLSVFAQLQLPCPPRRRGSAQLASARFCGRESALRAGLDPRLRGGRGPRGPLPSGPCDINGVILGIVLKIPVVGFGGIDAVAPRWAYRDSRDEPENDTVGGAGFRKVIAGRRPGPVFVRAPPVPITERAVEEHPERVVRAPCTRPTKTHSTASSESWMSGGLPGPCARFRARFMPGITSQQTPPRSGATVSSRHFA